MMVSRPSAEKWGNKFAGSHPDLSRLITGTAITGSFFYLAHSDLLERLVTAAKFVGHGAGTVESMVHGPPGMRAAKKLEELLPQLEIQSDLYQSANLALDRFNQARHQFAEKLVETYKTYETFANQARDLIIQMKGAANAIFNIGNEMKTKIPGGGFISSLDYQIIIAERKLRGSLGDKRYKGKSDNELFEMTINESKQMQEYFKSALKYFDAAKKKEATVEEVATHLQQRAEVIIQNQDQVKTWTEELFPSIIEIVKEGYSVRDYLHVLDKKGVTITKEDLKEAGIQVEKYTRGVDTVRGKAEEVMPMPEYTQANWPLVAALGAGAVLTSLGIVAHKIGPRIPIGKRVRSTMNYITTGLPRLIGNAASGTKDLLTGGYKQKQ